jgi:hypothetical protein
MKRNLTCSGHVVDTYVPTFTIFHYSLSSLYINFVSSMYDEKARERKKGLPSRRNLSHPTCKVNIRVLCTPFNLTMFVNGTKQFLTRPQTTWIVLHFNTRHNSTTSPSSTKLTHSYFHHASSLPFVYKTISQSFDETAAKYSDHECYVFTGILQLNIIFDIHYIL